MTALYDVSVKAHPAGHDAHADEVMLCAQRAHNTGFTAVFAERGTWTAAQKQPFIPLSSSEHVHVTPESDCTAM